MKESYPDFTAFDSNEKHFDPDSDPDKPKWFMVDVQFQEKFDHIIPLDELKANDALDGMQLIKRGNRLSVSPVSTPHWKAVLKMLK